MGKKKQIHYSSNYDSAFPACSAYLLIPDSVVTNDRAKVTCKNCKKTYLYLSAEIPENKKGSPPVMIRFKLVKFEKAIVFQVLEQNSNHEYVDKVTKQKVRSASYPQLLLIDKKLHILYLRGSEKSYDLRICTAECASNEERDALYDEIVNLIKLWAENTPSRKSCVSSDSDVFEF